jgi:hypothetical protein
MTVINRALIQTRYTLVQAGIGKHITGPVTFGGISYTAAQLAAPFQAWSTQATAVGTAKAAFHAAVLDEQAAFKAAQILWALLEAYCRVTYNGDTATLADFGFAPRKYTKPSPAVETAAIAKRAATRTARGTMGKKAKLAITGATPAPAPAAAPPVVTSSK